MRLPRLLQPGQIMPVFNRLVDELESTIRQTDVGTVTLEAGTTETVIPSRLAASRGVVMLTPADAVAAANQDWHATLTAGQVTITHGSNGSARSVHYLIA